MAEYVVRAWARSCNNADADVDGVVDVEAFPGDDEGLARALAALDGLTTDGARMLGACLESGIAARDVVEVGAGVFLLGAGKPAVRAVDGAVCKLAVGAGR